MSYKKTTAELLEDAKKGIRPSKQNQIPNLSTYLNMLLEKYHLNWKQIAGETAISKSQLYSFTNAANPVLPSRNQLISIMSVIGASLEETQNALNYAAYRCLYPRDPRDSIIISYLGKENRHKGVALINDTLFEAGYPTLSKQIP